MNNVKPKNPLTWIKYRYLEWRWDRVLKKSGCQSWEWYFRKKDPDFNVFGNTIKEQLFGYSYISKVDHQHLECVIDGMWGETWHGEAVNLWCVQNCRGKFRWQWERVIMDHMGQYAPNGIGGTDELFFGFKDERDYIMFTLRWT